MITHRIYCNRDTRLHYRLNVHKNLKALRSHCCWLTVSNKTEGLCSTEKVYSYKGALKPVVGEINLIQTKLCIEHVTHECAHAAFGYLHRKRISLVEPVREGVMEIDCPEETFCYTVGYMVKQVVHFLQKEKVW